MKRKEEKQIGYLLREPTVGASRQGYEAFRSGAADDEFDGFARYSDRRWPKGKLGGNAGIYSRPYEGREFFVFSHKSSENNAYGVITL